MARGYVYRCKFCGHRVLRCVVFPTAYKSVRINFYYCSFQGAILSEDNVDSVPVRVMPSEYTEGYKTTVRQTI